MPEQAKYIQGFSRQYPGLFVILLDQSDSMSEHLEESSQSKALIITSYVNSIINSMIEYAQFDEFTGRRKNYAYVSILGYNDKTYPLLATGYAPVSLPDLDEMVKGYDFVERKIIDQSGKTIRRLRQKQRFWIEPRAEDTTEMVRAFEEAEKIVKNWLNSSPEYINSVLGLERPRMQCFPPIIINITDAKYNGEGDPESVAERIRSIHTEDGNVLIYNCHFTHKRVQPCLFPRDIADVRRRTGSKQAEYMFRMSSELPETLRSKAERVMQMPIASGARCFVYNASPDILLRFLTWTTLGVPGAGERRR